MKSLSLSTIVTILFLFLLFNSLFAQDSTKTENKKDATEHQQHFIDEDGDGYNDNAPDHDGDGIPNGLDADWQKLNEEKRNRQRFVDLDGDGINDNIHNEEDPLNDEHQRQGLHEQKKGSSLDNKSKEEQQKQQKKQRGKP